MRNYEIISVFSEEEPSPVLLYLRNDGKAMRVEFLSTGRILTFAPCDEVKRVIVTEHEEKLSKKRKRTVKARETAKSKQDSRK